MPTCTDVGVGQPVTKAIANIATASKKFIPEPVGQDDEAWRQPLAREAALLLGIVLTEDAHERTQRDPIQRINNAAHLFADEARRKPNPNSSTFIPASRAVMKWPNSWTSMRRLSTGTIIR